MTKQFDIFSMSGELVTRVNIEESTLVREILQQISDITGTPKINMSLVCPAADLEAANAVYLEDAYLSKQCFAEGAETSLTLVIFHTDKQEPAEALPTQDLTLRHVLKKLTPCMQSWACAAFKGLAILSAVVIALTVFVSFIYFCIAMDGITSPEGPNLFDKISFVIAVSVTSISVISLVSWSVYKAVAHVKLRESVQKCAYVTIVGVAGLSAIGVVVTIFLGFIHFCVSMDGMTAPDGPNLFDKVCFGIAVSVTSISLIILVAWSVYKAAVQGKFGERVKRCAYVIILAVATFSILGAAVTVFLGFIHFCMAMDSSTAPDGPNLFDKICFGVAVSIVSICLISVATWSVHKAVNQGNLRASTHRCAYDAVRGLAALTLLAVALTIFFGFILCCIAMGNVGNPGPNLFELICFVAMVSGAVFGSCGFLCMQIRDVVKEALQN